MLRQHPFTHGNGDGRSVTKVGAAVADVLSSDTPSVSSVVGLLQTNNYGGVLTNYKKKANKTTYSQKFVDLLTEGVKAAKSKAKAALVAASEERRKYASEFAAKYANAETEKKLAESLVSPQVSPEIAARWAKEDLAKLAKDTFHTDGAYTFLRRVAEPRDKAVMDKLLDEDYEYRTLAALVGKR